ncbi:MAG: ATP-binding cassette domain-containing protein [Acidobacteriota bacterium]
MTVSLRVEGLSKTFRRRTRAPGLLAALGALVRPAHEEVEAVVDLGFEVERGERVAFLGPNGAGKSTSLKMMTGILHPSSGQAEVLGLVPWEQRRRLVRRLGCVFGQRSQLWYHLPVAETFDLLARVFGLPAADARRRRDELAELFEFSHLLEQPVRQLSLGQRMRCELAASLLHRPELLLLDEPTIGLDVLARARIRSLLARLGEEEGVTLLLTSHDAGDVEEVCDRVLFIDEGRLVFDGSLDELMAGHRRFRRLEAVVAEEGFRCERPGVEHLEAPAHRVILRVDTEVTPLEEVVGALLAGAQVHDLSISGPRLETVLRSIHSSQAEAGS